MEIARDKNNNHMQAVVIDTAINVGVEDSPYKIPEGLYRFVAKEDTEFWIIFQDENHKRKEEQNIFMPAGSVEYFYAYEGGNNNHKGFFECYGNWAEIYRKLMHCHVSKCW